MRLNIIITLVLMTFSSFGQSRFNSESMLVTRADLKQNIFSKDSTANALVIHESADSRIDTYDYKLYHNVHRKIKILNKEGFNYATEEVVLYNNT